MPAPRFLPPISRRRLLRLLGAAPLLGTLASSRGRAAEDTHVQLGPFLARPSARSTSLWLEAREGAPGDAIAIDSARDVSTNASFARIDDGLHLATFTHLRPDTTYGYHFVDALGVPRSGGFRTFPTEDGVAHLAFGADIHAWSAPYLTFDRIREAQPHVYVGLGDQVYADVEASRVAAPSFDGYAELYRRDWNDAALLDCWANVPAVLTWDDHEIWNDYDGGQFLDRFGPARAAYERFQRTRVSDSTPWSILRVGPAEVFVLDTRSFRDRNYGGDSPVKSMIGLAQWDAVVRWLGSSTAKMRILASPTPFHRYVTTGADAWAFGFAAERELLFRAIDANDPSRTILVSGDQHWPGVFAHRLPSGAEVIELQCTPTAAFSRPQPTQTGADALYVDGEHCGYGALTVDGRGGAASARFAWVDSSGATRFSYRWG